MATAKIDLDEMREYCLRKARETGGEGWVPETDAEIESRHARELAEHRAKSAEVYWRYRVKNSGLPEMFENPSTPWEKVPGTEEMVNAVLDYERDMDENISKGVNLIIIGGMVGTGKTRAVARLGFNMLRGKHDVAFFDDKVLASRLDLGSFSMEEEVEELVARLKSCGVLIIDDFGDGRYSPRAEARRDEVIAHRWSHSKPIAMTGNWLNLSDMKEKMPERIYSRLNERTIIGVNHSNVDMRLAKK